MGAEVELHRLVDLALRSPDAGVVNFNHLHTLLHAILNHLASTGSLKASNGTATQQSDQVNGDLDCENKTAADSESSTLNEFKKHTKLTDILEEKPYNEWKSSKLKELDNSESVNVEELKSIRLHQQNVEKKVLELESKLKLLDEIPSNKLIIEHAQQKDVSTSCDVGSPQTSLIGVWQFMKINSRLQAAEEAIDRIMSILNEFFKGGPQSMKEVQSEVSGLADDVSILKNMLQGGGLEERLNSLADMQEKLQSFSNLERLSETPKGVDNLVTRDELKEYVRWPALQDALNVKKGSEAVEDITMIDYNQDTQTARPKSAPESSNQTPVVTPAPPKTAVSQCTQVGSPEIPRLTTATEHPSDEMLECLRQIGELTAKHEAVAEEVSNLMKNQEHLRGDLGRVEEILPTSLEKDGWNAQEEIQQQLLKMQEDQGSLAEVRRVARDNKDQIERVKREMAVMARQSSKPMVIERTTTPHPGTDTEALNTLRGHLVELQNEQEKITDEVERRQAELLEDLSRKQEHIDALYDYVEKLQENKANKENVAMEMDVMADKIALDNKISQARFDDTFSMLGEGLREAMQKMDEYMNEEMALKQALAKLSSDLKGKMDGHAFQALRDYLESRIAEVQKSKNRIAEEAKMSPAEAAGLRRRISLNCISCNRPVHVGVKDRSHPSLPLAQSVRMKKSKGPYLSYEMDQIRHFQRTSYSLSGHIRDDRNSALTVKDFMVSGRPCGGSHTVMYNQLRRPARIAQLNHILANTVREETIPQETRNWSREVSVIDMLQGSDGHLYKGRYKQDKGRYKQTLPSIPIRNSTSSLEGSGRSDSASQSSDGREMTATNLAELDRPQPQGEEKRASQSERFTQATEENTCEKTVTPPTSRQTSPRARMKQMVKRHSSRTLPSNPVPSPSPPTVSEGEYQQVLQRNEAQQRKQEGQSKMFVPQLSTEAVPQTEALLTVLEKRSSADGHPRRDSSEVSKQASSPQLQALSTADPGSPARLPNPERDRSNSIDSVDVP